MRADTERQIAEVLAAHDATMLLIRWWARLWRRTHAVPVARISVRHGDGAIAFRPAWTCGYALRCGRGGFRRSR